MAAFAGRLIRGKGADLLLRAAALVPVAARPRLVIAGDGPERPNLERLARELGVDAEFRGWVQHMPGFWSSCDVAVVPSDAWRESFGLVATEAMACARPVVASSQPALAEIVRDRLTGILVPPGDPDALSRALERYGNDPQLREAHGLAARREVEQRFAIDDAARAYRLLFA